ncbi:SDR family oxidoreductase [Aquabacterium sp.]|uniref:SDR family oxidoreductase n=1 Tax=Aquabacterium sp. TaxID=1872578 RepID=UPI002489CA7C|nr:SDR family oxidoreductase [Aquabacterium sp.]MDI1261470.1 SDR family oxidoreductase [Aquabacterium sp.]
MKLNNAVVLITGANRGLGLAFAQEALVRGARKVYAGARDPASVTLPGVIPVKLDVTDPADVARVAAELGDVTLLINNAGIANTGGFLAPNSVESARAHMETNFFGPLRLSQAFASVLAANGGGGIINVLSVVSWINAPVLGVYSASKSAAWGLTNGLRHELRPQKTQVLGLHVGFIDTDMARGFDAPKTPPGVIAARTLDALEAGADEVLADEVTQQVKQGLSAEPGVYLVAADA